MYSNKNRVPTEKRDSTIIYDSAESGWSNSHAGGTRPGAHANSGATNANDAIYGPLANAIGAAEPVYFEHHDVIRGDATYWSSSRDATSWPPTRDATSWPPTRDATSWTSATISKRGKYILRV